MLPFVIYYSLSTESPPHNKGVYGLYPFKLLDMSLPLLWSLEQWFVYSDVFQYYWYHYTKSPVCCKFLLWFHAKEKTSSSKAHSKGSVGFNKKTGFWLIHSVPRYPNFAKDGYAYPRCSIQTNVFCVSFDVSKFDSVGKQLRIIGPKIHDSFLPQAMAQGLPNIVALLQGMFFYKRSI